MYREIFKNYEPKFNRKLVNKLVLIIKKGDDSPVTDKAKLELFKMMKKIVVKNVRNYLNLAYNSYVTEDCLEEDEMYSEAYIVLIKCIENYKVSKKNCFYFYFNKSISRNFYRMFDKEIRKFDGLKGYKDVTKSTSKQQDIFRDDIYSVEFVSEILDLDEFDKKVLKSKLAFEKKDDFIVNNEDATVSKYYVSMRKIKEQVSKLVEDGDI